MNGIGVPTTATILPEKYTIIEVNALEALGVDDRSEGQAVYYLAYLHKEMPRVSSSVQPKLANQGPRALAWGHEN